MKKRLILITLFLTFFSALPQEENRIQLLKNNLEILAVDNPEFTETLKLEVNVTNVTLPNFLMAVSKVHQLNLSVSNDVSNITLVNNFSNVSVSDLLLFLCKEYNLTIDFTGSILSIKRYAPPPVIPKEKDISVIYTPTTGTISMDVKNDPLDKVFRKIMEASGQNLLYANALKDIPLNLFLNEVPLDMALEKLADLNNLSFSKSRDGFYLFNAMETAGFGTAQIRGFKKGMHYEVLDTINKVLNVDFKNSSIAKVIDALSHDLKLDVYTATPLEEAGTVTFNAKGIVFDDVLAHIFESQDNTSPQQPNTNQQNSGRSRPNNGSTIQASQGIKKFTFKKENNIYFFGTDNQLSLRQVAVVQMMHRSVELLSDPSYYSGGSRTAGRTNSSNVNFIGNGGNNGFQNNQQGTQNNRRSINTQTNGFDQYQDGTEALVSILPDEIKSDLDIKVDFELNSFLVSGPAANIQRFKSFVKKIDKPVPVVLIEVMIIEVRKSASIETGISWGIGDNPVETRGGIFPSADVTLGAKTVNKVIGGFDGFGSFNIGKVVPNFFANIKALEESGNIKIRSTPKLSTLNGHRANLSIGETTYYVITNQNFFGSQIPTASEVRNYAPIDAELGVSIKPLVSGDGQVTLDISVIQSDFSGERIEEDAPPGLTSREFSSIIRMQNQDLAILGGLEEKVKNDSGSGVPGLARVPILKWFFSKRKREDSKQKLTILIKPTVIY